MLPVQDALLRLYKTLLRNPNFNSDSVCSAQFYVYRMEMRETDT